MNDGNILKLIAWHESELKHCETAAGSGTGTNREKRRWISRCNNHARSISALKQLIDVQLRLEAMQNQWASRPVTDHLEIALEREILKREAAEEILKRFYQSQKPLSAAISKATGAAP